MQITLRDYARQNGVSYEAVRQQVKRYAAALEGHIHHIGRTQYLDAEAIQYLDNKRAQHPMIMYEKSKDQELQELRDKVVMLQAKLIEAQEQVVASQGALVEAQAARLALAAAESERDELATAAAQARQEAAAANQVAEELRQALAAAEAREEALRRRTWWQRLTRRGE